jgi:hypothetical protein
MAARAKAAVAPPPSPIEIFDCEQGGMEWLMCRLGRITASNFAPLLADSAEQKGRTKLLRTLAGEIITGKPAATYSNSKMERGKVLEPEVRDWYARTRFEDIKQVGFIFNHEIGAGWSPDGFVGDDGAIEVKTADPDILIGILDRGTMPNEHKPQCHGGLMVGRRHWVDLVIYSPGLPKYVARLERDDAYCQKLHEAIEVFNWDLKKLVERIRSMGKS